MKTKGISRVVALLLLFTLLLSVSPLTEVAWAAETETGAAEPVPQDQQFKHSFRPPLQVPVSCPESRSVSSGGSVSSEYNSFFH